MQLTALRKKCWNPDLSAALTADCTSTSSFTALQQPFTKSLILEAWHKYRNLLRLASKCFHKMQEIAQEGENSDSERRRSCGLEPSGAGEADQGEPLWLQ